jgi:TM2 domain-containing membrane protein YozV
MLLALILPWLSLMINGRVFAGLICLILQCTLIGWLPAAIWAIVSLSNQRADRRTDKLIAAIKSGKQMA